MPSASSTRVDASDVGVFDLACRGPHSADADLSRQTGRVIAVTDRAGAQWIVKTVESLLEFRRERRPDSESIAADLVTIARKGVETLRNDFGQLPLVPTHGDYGGHNWLRGADRIRIIDFSASRDNVAAADFARLFIGPWWERPDLVAAFLAGAGRVRAEPGSGCRDWAGAGRGRKGTRDRCTPATDGDLARPPVI